MMRDTLILTRILVVCALVCSLDMPVPAATALTLHHIHGLSYSADGKQLYIPMHYGLAAYSDGQWSQMPGPAHDYMGFAVTREFFYSSGHPALGSPLKNPFGLIKSKDRGQTWEHLGLTGEADFHLLATSYHTNTVYVFNPTANSRMPHPGLYFTTDDGRQWRAAKAAGVAGSVASLAVHPTQDKVVAVGTGSGLYLSQDYGATFQRLVRRPQVLAICFAFDEQHLWFSSFDRAPALTRLHWPTGRTEPLALPPLHQDTVTYIAHNPALPRQWAIATHKRDVYISPDDGNTWQQIARQGETR